jgi:hypothetical protein
MVTRARRRIDFAWTKSADEGWLLVRLETSFAASDQRRPVPGPPGVLGSFPRVESPLLRSSNHAATMSVWP